MKTRITFTPKHSTGPFEIHQMATGLMFFEKSPSGAIINCIECLPPNDEANAALCAVAPEMAVILWHTFCMAMLDDGSLGQHDSIKNAITAKKPQEKWGPFSQDIFSILLRARCLTVENTP